MRAGLYEYRGRLVTQTEWGPGPRGGKVLRWEVADRDEYGEITLSSPFTHVTRSGAMKQIDEELA